MNCKIISPKAKYISPDHLPSPVWFCGNQKADYYTIIFAMKIPKISNRHIHNLKQGCTESQTGFQESGGIYLGYHMGF